VPVGPPRGDPDILTLPGTGGSRVRKFVFRMNFHMAHFCFMNFSTEKFFLQGKIQMFTRLCLVNARHGCRGVNRHRDGAPEMPRE
jgi:hypothetical protein